MSDQQHKSCCSAKRSDIAEPAVLKELKQSAVETNEDALGFAEHDMAFIPGVHS
ncbi:hypothetical protein JNUCC1_01086 [Lentibacillus sp. JNUCC-1]|uniref:hypothetical protein n=1 Tax=Lentibacillus sp. JNUCC-1 TaxID=2654513 RepID=UPI0012E8482C|nr:hypothetical protein [Lentibacillus sp. JNUCC-1]